MSDAHAKANSEKWAKVDPVERSKRMSKLARSRMKKLTPEQRKKIGLDLVAARKKAAKKRK